MEINRSPFQGVWNIIRFNWHFYLLSFAMLLFVFLSSLYLPQSLRFYAQFLFVLMLTAILISLLVSCYVYDFSDLYSLNWLPVTAENKNLKLVNINAGFDETSALLSDRFKSAEFFVFDFYDSVTHTEVSIKRARKAYPPFKGTQQIKTTAIPIEDGFADKIFLIFAAHEIRNGAERLAFFKELNRTLKTDGELIVTEHLRDVPNFLAYTIGFLHFYTKALWLKTFHLSGFVVEKRVKITPFVTAFILKKHGASS